MKILVINCGSSSLKYKLFEMNGEVRILEGLVERIGFESPLTQKNEKGEKLEITEKTSNHSDGFRLALKAMQHPKLGALKNADEIVAVGHRVVHGASKYREPVLITPEVMKDIDDFSLYAPLHNPANLAGIKAGMEIFKDIPHVGVFDTAFHYSLPDYAYWYGIPYELAKKYEIRKYGFHGTSHQYVAERTARILGKPFNSLKIITCHIGAGASLTAVEYGKSVDTTMGMTPLQGLVMGTRSGSMDPSVVVFLMEREKLTGDQVLDLLNKKSGFQGLSGISKDMRDIEKAASEGNARAKLTLAVHAYQVKKFIGSYICAMNGVDAVTFTAGVGENAPELRADVCKNLSFIGVKLDGAKNRETIRGKEAVISAPESRVKILVVPTNEEIMIARETLRNLHSRLAPSN